jgi:hypothetical protein
MMSPQPLLSRRRLSAVALVILAGTTYPTGPIGAQRISRFFQLPGHKAILRKAPVDPLSGLRISPAVLDRVRRAFDATETPPDALGPFSAGSDVSVPGSFMPRDTPAFWGTHRATISKQPLIPFENLDLTMPRRESSLHDLFSDRIGEAVGPAEKDSK